MMVKRYAHLAPEHLRAAASALDGVMALDLDGKETASQLDGALSTHEIGRGVSVGVSPADAW